MKIKPLGKRVLVKQIEQEEITKSGIVLPRTVSKEKPITGEVLAVGKKIEDIKPGERIIYEKYTGTEVKDGEEVYLILDIDNVLGIIE